MDTFNRSQPAVLDDQIFMQCWLHRNCAKSIFFVKVWGDSSIHKDSICSQSITSNLSFWAHFLNITHRKKDKRRRRTVFENHRKSLIQPKIPKNGQFGEVLFYFSLRFLVIVVLLLLALFSKNSFTSVGAF